MNLRKSSESSTTRTRLDNVSTQPPLSPNPTTKVSLLVCIENAMFRNSGRYRRARITSLGILAGRLIRKEVLNTTPHTMPGKLESPPSELTGAQISRMYLQDNRKSVVIRDMIITRTAQPQSRVDTRHLKTRGGQARPRWVKASTCCSDPAAR